MSDQLERIDKTERAYEEIKRWKDQCRKGEITLMFDGSGRLAKIKITHYI